MHMCGLERGSDGYYVAGHFFGQIRDSCSEENQKLNDLSDIAPRPV